MAPSLSRKLLKRGTKNNSKRVFALCPCSTDLSTEGWGGRIQTAPRPQKQQLSRAGETSQFWWEGLSQALTDNETATKEWRSIPQLSPDSRKTFFITLWKAAWFTWSKSCYDLVYFNSITLWKRFRSEFSVDLCGWDKLCCPALLCHLNWLANASC